MFRKKPNPEMDELNAEITRVLAVLARIEPDSEEYAAAADQIVKLYAQKEKIPSNRVSPDMMATVTANILGIILVVGHERANVIGGRAIQFVKQLKN